MPKITITSPAEGATWPVGSQRSITWTSVNVTTGVFICLSVDGGQNWDWLNQGTPVPNNGIYHVTVPNIPSTACMIKMTSQSDWFYDWFSLGYFAITQGPDAVADQSAEIPKSYLLNQNYPNPFNPSTLINYSVPKQGNVMIIVYDALGREVRTLINEEKAAGSYTTEFNAANLSSGIYYYQIRADEFIQTKKIVLLK